jgi:hypothetical protein
MTRQLRRFVDTYATMTDAAQKAQSIQSRAVLEPAYTFIYTLRGIREPRLEAPFAGGWGVRRRLLGLPLGVAAVFVVSVPAHAAKQPPPVATCSNRSVLTQCAEEVNIPLRGRTVRSFAIEATHPRYAVGADSCDTNFTSCSFTGGASYPFEPADVALFDDGDTVVKAIREREFWWPRGMLVSVDDGRRVADIH